MWVLFFMIFGILRAQSGQDECAILEASRFAKLIPEQVDAKAKAAATETIKNTDQKPWYETEEHLERNFIAKKIVQEQFPFQLCDTDEFSPSVVSLNRIMSCEHICRKCFAGSVSICLLRNSKYMQMGETCLCTYSLTDPISDAAFSLRHERRIFSRRIRHA